MHSPPPPTMQRTVMDFDDHDHILNNTSNDRIELEWNDTSEYGVEELGDGEAQELDSSWVGDKDLSHLTSAERRRKLRRKRSLERERDERFKRNRRLFIMSCATIPFIIALTSLLVVMKEQLSSNDESFAMTITDALNEVAAGATVVPLGSSSSSDSDGDVPTPAPSALALVAEIEMLAAATTDAERPSPRPTEAVVSSPSGGGDSDEQSLPAPTVMALPSSDNDSDNGNSNYSGLRSTSSPASTPVAWDASQYRPGPEEEEVMTSSPSSGPTTMNPTTASPVVPAAATATMCVSAGFPCPKSKDECCSAKCEKSKDTGEQVCSAAKGNGGGQGQVGQGGKNNWMQGKGAGTAAKGANLSLKPKNTCVASGVTCPKDKKSCCSGKCSGDKDAQVCD